MTVFEWVIAASAVIVALALGAAPVTVSASFREMFRDFGSIDELSTLTRLVLARWYGFSVAVAVVGLVGAGLALRRRVWSRRGLWASALALGVFGLGLYLYGIYSPIFEVAEAIGP